MKTINKQELMELSYDDLIPISKKMAKGDFQKACLCCFWCYDPGTKNITRAGCCLPSRDQTYECLNWNPNTGEESRKFWTPMSVDPSKK